jgi:hypothetical protein
MSTLNPLTPEEFAAKCDAEEAARRAARKPAAAPPVKLSPFAQAAYDRAMAARQAADAEAAGRLRQAQADAAQVLDGARQRAAQAKIRAKFDAPRVISVRLAGGADNMTASDCVELYAAALGLLPERLAGRIATATIDAFVRTRPKPRTAKEIADALAAQKSGKRGPTAAEAFAALLSEATDVRPFAVAVFGLASAVVRANFVEMSEATAAMVRFLATIQ